MVMRQTNGIAKDDVSALEQLAQGLKSHVDTVQQQACLDFLSSRHVRALWPRDRDVKHPAGAEHDAAALRKARCRNSAVDSM
jgi:hypothetical protein